MKNPVPLSFTCSRATFTLIVAPLPVLTDAIAAALARRKDQSIGITGPWASVLPSVPVSKIRFPRRAVPSLAELQDLVVAVPRRFIVIEDGPLLHDEERAVPFWWACHTAAHERGATVILVSTRYQAHLAGAAEIADRAFFMQTIPAFPRPPAPDQQMIGNRGSAGVSVGIGDLRVETPAGRWAP